MYYTSITNMADGCVIGSIIVKGLNDISSEPITPYNFKTHTIFSHQGEIYTCEQILEIPEDKFQEIYSCVTTQLSLNRESLNRKRIAENLSPNLALQLQQGYDFEFMVTELIRVERLCSRLEKRVSTLESQVTD